MFTAMVNRKTDERGDGNRHGALDLFSDEDSHQTDGLNERTGKMLVALAEIGLDKTALAVLMQMVGVDRDLLRFFQGPLIVHNSLWMSSIPKWVARQAI